MQSVGFNNVGEPRLCLPSLMGRVPLCGGRG